MRLLFALGLLLPWTLVHTTPAAIDFRLHYEQTSTDAVALEKTYVVDGIHKIYLNLPSGWQVSSNPSALSLVSVDPGGAEARLEEVNGDPAGKPPGHDPANRLALRQQALGLLPPGSRDVLFQGEEMNPVALFGWTSFEVTHAYSHYGQSYLQSTMVLRMGSDRSLRVTVNARRADFPKVYPLVRASLLSWFEQDIDLSTGEGLPFRGN